MLRQLQRALRGARLLLLMSCAIPMTTALSQGIPVIDVASLTQAILSIMYQTQQLTQQITLVQQSVTNLEQLPSSVLNGATGMYASQAGQLAQISTEVGGLLQATQSIQQFAGRANSEMDSLDMTPAQWSQAYLNLAQTRGGAYQQQLDQDVASLNAFSARARSLQALSSQIPAVSGNVQGLQLLNQQANAQASELMQVSALMQRQAVLDTQDRLTKDQLDALSAKVAASRYSAVDERSKSRQSDIDDMKGLEF
ncbi:hypothetical protein [Achromobacter aloeverae]